MIVKFLKNIFFLNLKKAIIIIMNVKHKIFSEAFPPNEKGERQQLLSLSSFHNLVHGIEINTNEIIYKSLTKNNLLEIKNLHKEWFPIEYDDSYFQVILDNPCGNYFTIGAFYNIKNCNNNENKEIILGLALCEWDSISDYFINHTNSQTIEEISKNINVNEEVIACLKCQYYHCVYIMNIGVLDEYRKMNIGSNILTQILNIALKDDICVGIYLDVINYNKSAIKFYEKNNYKKVNEIKEYYEINGKKHDAHVYLRVITRKEKDEFREKNKTSSFKFINKYIINPITYIIKGFLFILLFQCCRKKKN